MKKQKNYPGYQEKEKKQLFYRENLFKKLENIQHTNGSVFRQCNDQFADTNTGLDWGAIFMNNLSAG